MFGLVLGEGAGGVAFAQRGAHGLVEGDLVAGVGGGGVGHGQGKGAGEIGDGAQQAILTVCLRQDVLLGLGQQAQARGGIAAGPGGPVETMEETAADVELFQEDGDGLGLVDGRLPLAAALGIGGERAAQGVGQAEIIHDQAAGLVLEDAVDAGDGLHEAVALHGLVHIQGVERGRVEAGEPHIAHDDQTEGVGGVAEAAGEGFPRGFGAHVGLEGGGVGSRAGHHHLEAAAPRGLPVIAAVPIRAQGDQRVVEVYADAAAHADDHAFALQGLQPLLKVGDEIGGDGGDARVGPDQGFQLRPFGLERFALLGFCALGDGLEFVVQDGLEGVVERELDQAALVVDGHGGAVGHGLLDVVDADVVAEDGAGVFVGEFDGRAGEADEGGVGQGIAQVGGEAVDEVILAAVGFVGDDYDVAPRGEQGVTVAPFIGQELLQGGEDHAPGVDLELGAQVVAAGGLGGRLAQEIGAAGEGAEELVVQVVAVGDDDHRGVVQGRVADHPSGVEGHGQAFAGALRVPDYADALVAGRAAGLRFRAIGAARFAHARCISRVDGAQGFAQRDVDGVELVVAGQLLDQQAAAVVLEDLEVAHEIEKAAAVGHPLQDDLQFGQGGRGQVFAVDGAPGHEAFAVRGERPQARVAAVGDDQRGVVDKEAGDFGFVGLELVIGVPDGGLGVGGVFEFDHGQGQAVDEEDDVRAAVVAVLDDGELVEREPVIVRGVVGQELHLRAAQRAVGGVFDGDAVDQIAVGGAVAADEVGAVNARELAQGFVQRGGGQAGVQAGQRGAQPPAEDHLAVVGALAGGHPRRKVGAVGDGVAELVEPGQGGLFDHIFVEAGGHGGTTP